jgi:2,5-dihydroxypyridine 5,6-dioxygenase
MKAYDDTALATAATFIVRDFVCVQPGEQVLITADTASDQSAVHALLRAAVVQSARAAVVTVPQLRYQGALADPYVAEPLKAAMKACDVWLDLTFPYLAGSAAHADAMKAKRMRGLMFHDLDGAGMARMFAAVDFEKLFDLQEAIDNVINGAAGKTCRVTNALGTDVSFTIGRPATRKTRRIVEPGTYTPPGSAVIYPEIETVRGTMVVEAAFHEYFTLLRSPVTLKVDGRIRSVTGGGTDQQVLERALLRAGSGQYGSVIHFSHGFHPMARLHGGSFIESIRAIGCNAIGLGIPWWQPGGGENHPDAVVTMQSMSIDGEPLVRNGALVPRELARLEQVLHESLGK